LVATIEPAAVAAGGVDDPAVLEPAVAVDAAPAVDRDATDTTAPVPSIDYGAAPARSALSGLTETPADGPGAATVSPDQAGAVDTPATAAAVVTAALADGADVSGLGTAESVPVATAAPSFLSAVDADTAATAAPEPPVPEPLPPTPAPEPLAPVLQAGAVVLVRDKVALRLAKDQTWVLPKGHIETGESAEQAAVREVAEEMGLSGTLGPFVDELRFTTRDQERIVRYYLLRADRHLPTWNRHFGRDTFLFGQRDALARLTHDDARALLAQALELAQSR
jgi:8-oxo-dGTP pyrophosphatase MutT (NUDIX family)